MVYSCLEALSRDRAHLTHELQQKLHTSRERAMGALNGTLLHVSFKGWDMKFNLSKIRIKKNAFTLLLPLINPVPVVHFQNRFVSSFLRLLLSPC